MNNQNQKFSRRTLALFWTTIVAVVIGVLIYFEQIAVLYALATVSLVGLLLIVAFANLEKVGADGTDAFSSEL